MAPKKNPEDQIQEPSAVGLDKPLEEMSIEEIQRATAILSLKAAQAAFVASTQPRQQDQPMPREGRLSDDELELREVEKETALLNLEQARENNQKTKETKAQRIARRKAALANMQAEERTKQRIRRACRHHVGGKGLQDFLRGGKEGTSIICSSLPITGMKLYMCTRCFDEAITPSPLLKRDNPQEYARQLHKYQEFEELFAESYNSIEMGGPSFTFTHNATGMPIHPDMIPLAGDLEELLLANAESREPANA